MADNPVVIAGSLSTEELEKSINEIVNTVDKGMTDITEKFDTKLGDINTKIKTFSSSVKEMSKAMKESFDGMGGSFDALAQAIEKLSKAQKASTGNFGNGNDGSSNGSSGSTEYEEGTIGALKAQIAEITKKIDLEKLYSQELRDQVALLKESENLLKKETTSVPQKVLNSALQSTPKTLQDAEDKLATLNAIQEKYANTTKLSVQEQNRLSKAISQTEKQVEKLRNQQPKSLKDVMGMDESSVDAISRKLKELRKIQIDPKNANEVKMLSSEYQRLVRLQNEMMGKNLTLVGSNNALARSFNYIRNRLVYALSIGAITSFVKQVYDIRAQYELLERSLGVLVGSFQKGNEVFRELSDMALKSPFTLIELGNAAKQLTAYNFAAKDVVETTRRLADISAALGVPMERLTYNLGQIRAQTVLTARDARDFANAGLPIVKTLADYYTKLEGQLVSTGDVYERMTKRMVSYEDVMQVLEEMTDEGGKFFNFQAKQAETLKVQLANLSLAWNNMLNEIGKSNQGLLSEPLKGMKLMFENWKTLDKVITDIAVTLGVAKAAQIAFNLALSKGTLEQIKNVAANKEAVHTDYQAIFAKQGLTKAQAKYLLATNRGVRSLRKFIAETELLNTKQYLQAKNANALTVGWYRAQVAAQGLANGVRTVAASMAALAPQLAILLAISAIVDAIQAYKAGQQAIEDFGNTIRRNAEENAKSIKDFLDSFNIGNAKSLSLDEQVIAWEKIREQIEESTASSNRFISVLMQISDIGERVNVGKNMLSRLQQIHEIMSTWNDDTVKVNNGFKVLGVGADGLSEDLKDFVVAMNNGGEETGNILADTDLLESKWKSVVSWVYSYTDFLKKVQPLNPYAHLSSLGGKEEADIADAWQELQKELRKTTESLFNQLQRDKITDPFQIKEALEQTLKDRDEQDNWTTQQLLTARILAEQHFREYYKTMLNGQNKDWDNALGDRSAAWDAWLQYLTARHKNDFKGMAGEEVSQSEWVKSEKKKKYEETFEAFKKENALAANELINSVNDLNKLQVHIKVFYDEPKSVGEIGRDFLKRTGYWQGSKAYRDFAEGAGTQGQIIDKLKKSQKELAEEIERSEKAGGEYWEKNKLDMTTRNEDLIRMIHSYNALTDAEEKEKNKGKGRGKTKDPLLDALKQEISLVEKLQGDYEKLTKAGATSSDALLAVRSAYGTTIDLLNKDLNKYGLQELNLNIITSQSPKEQLEYFKELKQQLETSGLGNLDRMKTVEGIIEKLDIKVKEYNLGMVTKGLNNELGKLKEEYELGIEFDANPELGSIFADMMGMGREEMNKLPRTYAQLAKKMQESIDNVFADNDAIGKFDLEKMLNKADFDKWVEERGNKLDDAFITALNKIRVEMNKVRQKEAEDTVKNWSNLISKYGTIQDKLVSISKDTAKEELDVIKQFGSKEEIASAIDLAEKINVSKTPQEVTRLQKELMELLKKVAEGKNTAISVKAAIEKSEGKNKAKAIWENFKDSDEYIKMFDNLEYLSIGALDNIMNKLEEVKDKVREDPASMKAAFDSIEKVREAIMNFDPARGMAEGFNSFIQGIRELSATNSAIKATEKYLKLLRKELVDTQNELSDTLLELEDATGSGNEDRRLKAQLKFNELKSKEKELNEKISEQEGKQNDLQEKNENALEKIRNGLEHLAEGAQKWGNKLQNVSDAISAVGNVFAAIGDEETSESINDLNKGFQIMIGVLDAVAAACIVVKVALGAIYLVAMAIAGVFMGLAFLFEGSANRAITRQIEESEATVRKLELAYKDLEAAIEDAYGAAEYGLKQAEISNKKLQLAELKRQLELEKSRSGKHYDQEKVDEYLEKVKDLENEIANMVEDITNDMLGIQSVGNAAEELVSSMIDAFRKGEDYMASYQDTFDKMIENMIVKAIASRVIGDRLQEIWDTLDATISERSKPQREEVKKIQENIADYEKKIDEAAQDKLNAERLYLYPGLSGGRLKEAVEKYDKYTKLLDEENKKLQEAIEAASSAGQITPQDVNSIADMATNFKGEAMENFKALMDAFGIKFGDLAGEQELSNLQQGIQGITETTAGAIEAYLNGVSQQVYLHSDLLTEIRDAVVGMNISEQLGVQSEILLQLQNSYQTQQAIRNILEGWSNASGMAVKVEMV